MRKRCLRNTRDLRGQKGDAFTVSTSFPYVLFYTYLGPGSMTVRKNLYEYTNRALLIQTGTSSDRSESLQRVSVPGKILLACRPGGRSVETGLGYWEQPRDGVLLYFPTHLGTGSSICGSFPSERMARLFLETVAEKADWLLSTQLEMVEKHGSLYMKNLVVSSRVLAMQQDREHPVLVEGAYRRGYQQGAGAGRIAVLRMLEQGKSLEEIRVMLEEWDIMLGKWRDSLSIDGNVVMPPEPDWQV
jgi:hypothetical protein